MTKNVPIIAVTPMTSGIADATSAPKTNNRRRKVSGIEINSATLRSSWMFPLIAFANTASPET